LAQRTKFAERFRGTGGGSKGTRPLLSEMQEPPDGERATHPRRLGSDKVSAILRPPRGPERPPAQNRLDSLANLELRNFLKDEAGVRITPSDISTVNGLAGAVYDYLITSATEGETEAPKPLEIRRKKSIEEMADTTQGKQ